MKAKVAICMAMASLLLRAQDWTKVENLNGVDFSKLSATQKATALRAMRGQDCSCGCGRKVAQCRVEDPNCSYSKGMAAATVNAIADGQTEKQAQKAAIDSRWGHVEEQALLSPAISIPVAGSPFRGNPQARITLVEFSDFQCPYCAAAVEQLQGVLAAYPANVKLVFKQFPLEMHPQAQPAAEAALAAGKQGKFWQMHDALFASHNDLSPQSIITIAQGLGLDMKRFESDRHSTEVSEMIQRDVQDGEQAGVQGTPTIFIDGQRFNGPISLNTLRPVFEAELKLPPKASPAGSL